MTLVLVTRSEPGASETAGRLARLGHQPIVEPLFSLEAIPATPPPFDALAFTSANAVRAFAKLSAPRDAPVFCVGRRTAEAAREAGFGDVQSADGDVGALSRLIADKLAPGQHLLHSGNEDSRGDLAGQLAAHGISAVFVPTYRAAAAVKPGPVLAAHLRGEPHFKAVLIHSPRGASILAGFLKAASAAAPVDIAAISRAAAQPLDGLVRRAAVAATPDEAGLFAALAKLPDFG